MKKRQFIIICLLMYFPFSAEAQSKLEINAGVGLFEGVSLKARYGNNVQIGICQGFAQSTYWLSGIEGYYHFSGVSKFNEQRTNYFMLGISSTIFTSGYSRWEKILFYPRIGRTVYFTENAGLNLDIGIGMILMDDVYGYIPAPIPTFGVHFFLRL